LGEKPTSLCSASNSRPRRGLSIAVAAVSCAVAIGACGSSGPTNVSSGPTAQSKDDGALAFANCMRSHGVPHFPDPSGSGAGVQLLGSSSEINSPAFQSGQTSCQHLLPGGGPSSGPPSAQAHAQLLQISECMRRHGISSFPDPRPGSPPSNLGGYSAIIGHGGYLLAIPGSIDMSSPAFRQAATTCNFGPRRGPMPTP
jgi:hypothetical protein